MAINRAKKGEVLDKLTKAFQDASSVVFVNFKGLSVGNTTELRRKLKTEGVAYTVAKKTLTKKALGERGYTGEMPELTGELSVAYGSDAVAPAREVFAFQKKFPENLMILGGVFEGKYMTKGEIEGIAKIPAMQTLRGMFVNILNSPIQRTAIALNEIAKKKVPA